MAVEFFWQQLVGWLASRQIQQPIIVSGFAEARWQDFFDELKKRSDVPQEDVIEMADDEKSIKVKAVREVLARGRETSFSGRRLIIIPRAERLLREAANTLLKELEEPSRTNRWLLTTAFTGRLLPTIVSRCQVIRLLGTFWPDTPDTLPDPLGQIKQLDFSRKQPLSDDEIALAGEALAAMVRRGDTGRAVQRALLRLRDYHKIKAVRGNEKMASDVLVASLVQLGKNRS